MSIDNDFSRTEPQHGPYRKAIKVIIIILSVMVLSLLVIWAWRAGIFSNNGQQQPNGGDGATTTAPANLGGLPGEEGDPNQGTATSTGLNDDIEYIYFSDFYRAPSQELPSGLVPLSLPLNIKTDALNYYDMSRKIEIGGAVDSLNGNGFALMDNPWAKEAEDYYSLFAKLKEEGLPLYISSDFLFSYYNRSIQEAYKQIESEIFYQSLWNFSQQMYERAKLRYETRLAAMGQVNDPLLEAERMETVFFATALSLLSPDPSQVIAKNLNEKGLFSQEEAKKFAFTPVPYLAESIEKENTLIKSKKTAKSPIFLYDADYSRFAIPDEYTASEKLKNFYLASRWLNSTFPINYQSEACPDCLLDQDDWRIGFIASNLIVSDLHSDPNLKKEWAKIYKMMSYFTGLEDEYDYVKYHSALQGVLGEAYQADQAFESRDNPDFGKNIELARQTILSQSLLSIQGGEVAEKDKDAALGFKVLTDYYSASDLISSALSSPNVGPYLAKSPSKDNVTVCAKDAPLRCNGFSLDALSLVISPIGAAWQENTNYEDYEAARQNLSAKLAKDAIWQNNDYWFSLQLAKDYYSSYADISSGTYTSFAWREKMQDSAQSMWTVMQLPSDEGAINVIGGQSGLGAVGDDNTGLVFEPSLLMVRDMIASQDMVIAMISALGIDTQAKAASVRLRESKEVLEKLASMMEKQLAGQDIAVEDEEYVRTWLSGWKVSRKGAKTLLIGSKGEYKPYVIEDISNLKLMIVAHPTTEGVKLFIGPTIDHQEYR